MTIDFDTDCLFIEREIVTVTFAAESALDQYILTNSLLSRDFKEHLACLFDPCLVRLTKNMTSFGLSAVVIKFTL